VFSDVVEESVSYVNAPVLAKERGVEVALTTSGDSPDHRNLLTVRGTLPSGGTVSVSGTLVGPRQVEKLVEVDGFDIDLVPSDHMAFFRYHDRPGVVGAVGRLLGDEGINIGGMQVSRDERGGHALMALTVDAAVPPATLASITAAIGAESARAVDLAD
jgi:D-3-phosphoglycerate dehydrogenase